MTNNDKKTTDYNLEFTESTTHRDKLKNKKHGAGARILRGAINMLNKGQSELAAFAESRITPYLRDAEMGD